MASSLIKGTFIKIWHVIDWCRARFNSITNHPRVTTFGSLLIFLIALFIINKELSNYTIDDIVESFGDFHKLNAFIAVVFAFGAYLALTFNDRLCLDMIGKRLSYSKSIRGGLASYALAKTLGYSWAVASTARARLYKKWGLDNSEVGALSMTTGTGVQIGSLTCAAIGLFLGAPEIARHGPFDAVFWWILSLILFLPAILWLWFCHSDRASFKWGNTRIFLPTFKGGVGHLLLVMLDKIGAAACLYLMLPDYGGWNFPPFLAVFVLAGLLGALSGAPGGLGVFEAAILTMAPNSQNTPGAAVALLIYRLAYNIIPLIVATIILGIDHAAPVAKPAAKVVRKIGTRAINAAPQLLSLLVFIAGFILIASSATPVFSTRFIKLESYLGPNFIEFSHAFSAVIGMALMILSNFLWRESRTAFFIATFLLALGVINALFKGLSYEIAAVTGLALVLMIAFEGEFMRKFGRGGFKISYRFLAAIIGSMASIAWMSYFAFSDIKFTFDMLFETGVQAHASRAMRALIAAGGTFIIGLLILWLFGEETEELEADFD